MEAAAIVIGVPRAGACHANRGRSSIARRRASKIVSPSSVASICFLQPREESTRAFAAPAGDKTWR